MVLKIHAERNGMIELRGHEEPLIPSGAPVFECVHHFRGGMNLVSQPMP
jgi:hypothetical protein